MLTQIETNALHAQIRIPQELERLNETAKEIAKSLASIAKSLETLASSPTGTSPEPNYNN